MIKLGQSSNVQTGEFVIAIGCPTININTIMTGVVSSVARHLNVVPTFLGKMDLGNYWGIKPSIQKSQEVLQTDIDITSGYSGGPLINIDGEAIGINTHTENYNFAIPIGKSYADLYSNCN